MVVVQLYNMYVVHSPTNAVFINLVKSFKFALKYTIISLLHVSVINLLVSELHRFQNAWCNDKKKLYNIY